MLYVSAGRRISLAMGMHVPGLRKCANPGCPTEFKRLGTGKIYSLPVNQPQAWGLPAHVKQKVVWLCAKCALSQEVQFDEVHQQVLVVGRQRPRQRSA